MLPVRKIIVVSCSNKQEEDDDSSGGALRKMSSTSGEKYLGCFFFFPHQFDNSSNLPRDSLLLVNDPTKHLTNM